MRKRQKAGKPEAGASGVCGKKFFINFSSMFSRKLMMKMFSSIFSHQF
jgi:hypothetical protein